MGGLDQCDVSPCILILTLMIYQYQWHKTWCLRRGGSCRLPTPLLSPPLNKLRSRSVSRRNGVEIDSVPWIDICLGSLPIISTAIGSSAWIFQPLHSRKCQNCKEKYCNGYVEWRFTNYLTLVHPWFTFWYLWLLNHISHLLETPELNYFSNYGP